LLPLAESDDATLRGDLADLLGQIGAPAAMDMMLSGRSLSARAAKKLGVSRSQVTKWISPNASSAQRQMLLAAAMRYHQKKGPRKGSL